MDPTFQEVHYIISRHLSRDSTHFLNTYSDFVSNTQHEEKLISVEGIKLDNIKCLKDRFNWEAPSKESSTFHLLQRYAKSDLISTEFRELGNGAYRSRNFQPALRWYNLCVMFGRIGEAELCLAYGNRSALLLEMGKYSLALKDIELGLQSNCPLEVEAKLKERRERCKIRMMDSSVLVREGEKVNSIFHLESINGDFPSLSSLVKLDENEVYGRQLVVTEDVPCGTTLLVEKPFAVSLENELWFDTEHCHFCYISILSGIPCLICPFSLYCSLECRDQANKSFHKHEHGVLPYVYSQGMTERDLLILRILFTAGPETLWECFRQKRISGYPLSENGSSVSNISSQAFRYFRILNLIKHDTKNSLLELEYCFRSMLLLSLLESFTTFLEVRSLGTLSRTEEEDLKDFVVELILHHYQSIPFNAVSFSQLKESREISFPLGIGLFPTLSLLNHSCAPNAIHVKRGKHCETAVISLRPIPPGDQITITYGPRFFSTPLLERQEEMWRKYNFHCMCPACDGNWKTIRAKFDSIQCPSCTNLNSTSCSTCQEIRSQRKKLEELNGMLRLNLRPRGEVLKHLKSCIEFFHAKFPYPFQYTLIGEELLKKALLFECMDE